jgi:uncharacterized protein (DUF1501 family)
MAPRRPNGCDCAEHTRSELLRSAVAEAGRGLPAIERGMPSPAGTGLTRRSMLLRAAGLALAVYGGRALAPVALDAGVEEAMAAGSPNAVLVSVFLDGGVDSLSVLAPTEDPLYRSLRPTLALPNGEGTAFSEDPRLRWHPSASGFATLHGEGKVSVFPAIGYDDPDQSHFTSRHFWEVGGLDPRGRVGWLGRYLDVHGSADNPLQGLALDETLAPLLATAAKPVAAVSSPEDYGFWAPGVWGPVEERMLKAFGKLGRIPGGDPATRYARDQVAATASLRQQMASFEEFTPPVPYPDDEFAKRLAATAQMLSAGLPLRCVALTAPGGFDTHADQQATLPEDLKLAADALLAFQRDLELRGLADRVLTHVWSEFGRRPEENGSGTDHGAAGLSLVIGSRARGTMVGEFPGLSQLDPDDNLRATSDFRGLYCSLLEQWLGVDAGPIIPGAASFARPPVVK